MTKDDISNLIKTGINDSIVNVYSDDNTHFEAIVISDDFAGESRIARHQLIYACLGNTIGNEIHALSIKAYTHKEWASLE